MIGLTPQQKKHFDTLVSFLTISLLGLFAFIVALFLLTEISVAPKRKLLESESVQKGNYISENDIAIEKYSLPIFQEFPDDYSSTTPALHEMQEGDSEVISREEFVTRTGQVPVVIMPDRFTQTETMSVDSTSVMTNPIPTVAEVYVDPKSGVKISSVQVGYADVQPNSAKTAQIRQGIVFSIDREKQTMVLNSIKDGTQLVQITPETKFYINGKPIMFDNVSETDVVYVEGLGYDSVSEIIASTISIIGRFEIMTETN